MKRRAFTLVEILVALAVLGLALLFLQPNAARARSEGEGALMRQRAAMVDAATASWMAAVGEEAALAAWATANDDEARYRLIRGFLSRPPPSLADLAVSGFTVTFGASPTIPVRVVRDDGTVLLP